MTLKEFHTLVSTHPAFLLYFFNETCGVCINLWPRVEKVIGEKFPDIKLIRVDAQHSRELSGQLQMLTIPGMLLFIEGREYFRSSGMVSLAEMEKQIQKPYDHWQNSKIA